MSAAAPPVRTRRRMRPTRIALHAFLIVTSLAWLFPVLWALYAALRPYAETGGSKDGYFSLPRSLTLSNFTNAWSQADFPHYYRNTLMITIPALVITLTLASMVAFVVSRYSFRVNLLLLVLFTAGNLMPQQMLVVPLFQAYRRIPLPEWMNDKALLFDSYWGVIAVNVGFQVGFCVFVLSNYMKTIPKSLGEAALVDGASAFRQWWQVIMPLCRPALAALATLQFTWVYNDFLWALVLMQSGEKRPITSALNNLQGVFFTDNNLVAAGALLAAIPTMIVYFALQKHFISGLTLGADKG